MIFFFFIYTGGNVAKSRRAHRDAKKTTLRAVTQPTYRPPLLFAHHIPDNHFAPQLQYARPYPPQLLVKGTKLSGLVSKDETYDIPSYNDLPDKFAIFSPDFYTDRQFKVMKGDRIMISLLYNKETGKSYKKKKLFSS